MDPKDFDREMNQILERLTQKPSTSADPYSADPLSSDHFILSRSWDFFKKRIAAIEKQCQEIVNAKSEEVRILKKEQDLIRERVYELEQTNTSLEGMLANFKLTRLEDFEDFKKKNDRLKLSWDEERITLESTLMRLEHQIGRDKKKADDERKQYQEKIQALNKVIQDLKKDNQEMIVKFSEGQGEVEKVVLAKDEVLASSEMKVDLLRKEVERRDQIIQGLETTVGEFDLKNKAGSAEAESLRDQLFRRGEDMKALQSQIDFLKKEKASLQESWDREKAEWRELWDRAREVWKKPS